ncbi:MAG TPA: ABC-F family ATP-binding cassette domain-containing protein [Minicystis sp.]|nr:ABC-F family ATP-binding cassette domain-containing protein [Minicystis sp.]
MITVSKLGKAFGERVLFADASFSLDAGHRYGTVGANGSGKTTFLKIVAGDEPATEGIVAIRKGARVGVLRQDRFLSPDEEVLELAMMGDALVHGALAEQQRIAAGAADDASARLAELEDLVRAHDGYTLEARASAVLQGLGIPTPRHRRPLRELSGGFQLRVLLAQVLVGGPDVLLLDEPTNHLDILSIRWLEKFLVGYAGCALVISHDRRFLDNVATDVLDVDYGTISRHVGNYTAFEKDKAEILAQKEAERARQEAEIEHKKAYVERFRYKASKAKQAQSRLKQIDRIEVVDVPETTRRAPYLRFEPERPSGRDVLEVKGVDKAYGDHRVLRGVSLSVRRGEKVAVIGPNGLGKSTLLKILVGAALRDAGEVRWGHAVALGYFPQDHGEAFVDAPPTPLAFLDALAPKEPPSFFRAHLGRVLLSGEAAEKPIATLSGGEAARLLFAKLAIQRPNVLVLDEPTNHLDIESIQALVDAVRGFEGAALFVSHDRFFVSEVATRILELTPEGPRDFPGTYAEYLDKLGDDHLDADAVVLKSKEGAKSRAATNATTAADGNDWAEQKRARNRKKELPARRDAVLAEIATCEARRKAILDGYAEEGFFERTSAEAVEKLEAEQTALAARIEVLVGEWEALEREIEALAVPGDGSRPLPPRE